MQVHRYKIKAEREKKHSIHASFRELNEIYKMGNKKVRRKRRRRKLEEEEEEEVRRRRRRRRLEEGEED